MGTRNLFRFGPTREDRREKYLSQQDWYIDPVAGNDNNTGASGSPLKTWGEMRSRFCQGETRIANRIHLAGDIAEDLIVDWSSENQYSKGAYTIVYGARTTVAAAHTIATSVDYDPAYPVAGGTIGYFTDAAIADWTAYKDMMFVIVGGARDGCIGHIIGPAPGHVDRCMYQPMLSYTTGECVYMPQAGDTFTIFTVSKCTGTVQLTRGGVLQLVELEIDASATPSKGVIESTGWGNIYINACIVRGGHVIQPGGYCQPACCHLVLSQSGWEVTNGAFLDNWGNWWEGGQWVTGNGGFVDIQGHCVVTGTLIQASAFAGGLFRMFAPYWLCYNSPTTADKAIQITNGGILDATASQIWGTIAGTSAAAVVCDKDGRVFYDPNYPIAITGATHRYRIKETTYDDADLPVAVYPDGCVQQQRTIWTSTAAVTEVAPGNGMKKTGGAPTTWNDAYASCIYPITANGFLQFRVDDQTKQAICGLSHSPTGSTFAGIEFGVCIVGPLNTVRVYESGFAMDVGYAASPGDIIRIVVSGGVVTYYQNGTPLYTSLAAPVMSLYAQVNIYDSNMTISGVRVINT